MPKSLFISRLDAYTSVGDLHRLFSRYGHISDIYLPRDYYTRELRGFGYIEFDRTRDAERAMDSANHFKLNGQKIQVEWALGDRKTPHQMRRMSRRGNFDSFDRNRSSSRSNHYTRRSPSPGSRSHSRSRSRSRSPYKRSRSQSR